MTMNNPEQPIQENDTLYYPESRYQRTILFSFVAGIAIGLLIGVVVFG